MAADTLVAILSDMHSGGSTALFPNIFWEFSHKNHTPTKQQKMLFAHFDKCVKYVREKRKGKRLVLVHDGDAIEGYHHMTEQVITSNKAEQAKVHTWLMDYFMRGVKFGKGDDLYYINGTETHTGDAENGIAKDLGARRNPEGGWVFDHLELKINNRLLWFAHHGKGRGAGANEGNGLRNFLRNVYYDNVKRQQPQPDFIITGHAHTPSYNTFIVREFGDFRTMHGIICPSWQMKTRYAYRVAPVDVNEIGMVSFVVKADGSIEQPRFILLLTR